MGWETALDDGPRFHTSNDEHLCGGRGPYWVATIKISFREAQACAQRGRSILFAAFDGVSDGDAPHWRYAGAPKGQPNYTVLVEPASPGTSLKGSPVRTNPSTGHAGLRTRTRPSQDRVPWLKILAF